MDIAGACFLIALGIVAAVLIAVGERRGKPPSCVVFDEPAEPVHDPFGQPYHRHPLFRARPDEDRV